MPHSNEAENTICQKCVVCGQLALPDNSQSSIETIFASVEIRHEEDGATMQDMIGQRLGLVDGGTVEVTTEPQDHIEKEKQERTPDWASSRGRGNGRLDESLTQEAKGRREEIVASLIHDMVRARKENATWWASNNVEPDPDTETLRERANLYLAMGQKDKRKDMTKDVERFLWQELRDSRENREVNRQVVFRRYKGRVRTLLHSFEQAGEFIRPASSGESGTPPVGGKAKRAPSKSRNDSMRSVGGKAGSADSVAPVGCHRRTHDASIKIRRGPPAYPTRVYDNVARG